MSTRTMWTGLFILTLAAIGGVMAACSAVSFDGMVKTRTPLSIQQDQGLPGKIPLDQARNTYQQWLAETKSEADQKIAEFEAWKQRQQLASRQWAEEIESAQFRSDALGALLMQGLEQATTAASGVPYLSAAVPILAGLGGLLIKRPGDVSSRDKEKAFNKGVEEGKRAALETTREALALGSMRAPTPT